MGFFEGGLVMKIMSDDTFLKRWLSKNSMFMFLHPLLKRLSLHHPHNIHVHFFSSLCGFFFSPSYTYMLVHLGWLNFPTPQSYNMIQCFLLIPHTRSSKR